MLRRRTWAWATALAVAATGPALAANRSTHGVITLPTPHGPYSYAEPTIATGRDGTVLISAATANADVPPTLWLSRDDGRHWTVTPPYDGSGASTGDSDVAVGADGWLYALNLAYSADPSKQPANPTVLVYRSRDGKRWFGPATFPVPHGVDQPDRPWLLVDPRHPADVSVLNSEGGGDVVIWRSTDHGATFTGPAPVTGGLNSQAALALSSRPLADPSRDGRLFLLYEAMTASGLRQSLGLPLYEFPTTQLWLATSTDHGTTWSNSEVLDTADLPGADTGGILGHLLVASAVDDRGRLYAAYSFRAPGATTTSIKLLRSTDHGATWSAPVTVPSPMASNAMPALAVSGGTAYLSWYGSPDRDFRADGTRWYELMATVRDVSGTPRFEVARLTASPVHVGGIDAAGALAVRPSAVGLGANWGLRDFQGIAVDRHGRPHPVWGADHPRGSTQTLG